MKRIVFDYFDLFVIVHQVQNCDIGGHFQNLLEQLCHRGSNICELKYFAKLPPPGCSGRLTLIDPSSAAIFPPSKLLSGGGKIPLK